MNCPSCSKSLQVPDDLLGKRIKCPKCATAFTAEVSAPASEFAFGAEGPATGPTQAAFDFRDRPLPKSRGVLALIAGLVSIIWIIGLFCTGFALSTIHPIVAALGVLIMSLIGMAIGGGAALMARSDLTRMRKGLTDPGLRGVCIAGLICGIVGLALNLALVLCNTIALVFNALVD